jgi:hypothetical protein
MAMDTIIIILALDIEVMMMTPVLVLVVVDIKQHHPPAPVVAAMIAQWTLMLGEMVGVT